MNGPPRDDLDRFNSLLVLRDRGVLSEDEVRHVGRVYWAARWGALTGAFGFICAAMGARVAKRTGQKPYFKTYSYFSAEERAAIDAILARHETDRAAH